MTVEFDILKALQVNLDATGAHYANGDFTSPEVRALAEQEARLMDELRAVWKQKRGE